MTLTSVDIEDYYIYHTPELPPDYEHRYFKFVWKSEKHAIHIRDRIKSELHLKQLLIKYAPEHAYYSLTTWLDPTTVRGRKQNSVPLWSNVVLDIDAEYLSDAKQTTIRALQYLRNNGYRRLRVLFTGHKGFHIYVDDFQYSSYPEDYRERARMFEKEKKELIDNLLAEGISVDPALWDLYRVVRIPNTLNADTMLPAIWIKNIHRFTPPTLEETHVVSPPPTTKTYEYTALISSHVLGTPDRHVLFLDYDYTNLDNILAEVRELATKYKLTYGVIFSTRKGFNVWFFDALPLKTILRIKRNSTEDEMHTDYIKTYGYDIARFWYKVSDIYGVVAEPPRYYKVLNYKTGNKRKWPQSTGHIDFAEKMWGYSIPKEYPIGNPTVKVMLAARKV